MSNATGDGRSSRAEARDEALAYARSIIDSLREPLLVLDADLRVRSANRSFYRTFRVSPQDTEGRLLYDLGNRQWDVPRLRILLEEILPRNTSFDDFEIENDFPTIGRKVMLLNARRLQQEGEDQVLLRIEDVTERRRAEAERRDIESHFNALVKNLKDHAILTLDSEGRVTRWNVAAEHVLGYTKAEALGRHLAFIFTPEDREQGVPEAELRAAREQGRAEDERWHLRKGGERFWALDIVSALHDTDGRLTGFSKILRDKTDWKRAAQGLQASQRRLRMALDVAYTLAFEWDIPRNEVRRHHSCIGAVPETPEERPSSLEEFCAAVHPDDRESFLANLRAALAHPERGYRAEFRLCEPDGRIVWLADHGYLECDGQGQPQRLVGLSQDITERKAAEDALRASEVRYRTLVEATGAVTWSCPPSGLQVTPQPEWMEFTGQTAEQMLGTGWGDSVHPEDVALAAQRWQDAVAREEPLVNEHRIRRHDGEWRWMSVHAAPIRDMRGEVVEWIGMNLDITERKRSEEAALAASELARQRLTELEELYQNAPVGLCLLDRDLRFLRINERLAEINGVPAAEHLNKTVREVLPMLADMAEPSLREVVETGQGRFNIEVVGETLARTGVQRTWVGHWLPVKDFAGRVIGVNIVVEEITERKQAEAALRESVRRKDEFLATLAHELRNPLAPIRTGLDLIQALRGDAAACEEPIRMMDRQLSHLVRLVDDLLDVSRISRGKIQLRKERLTLKGIIDAAVQMSDSALTRGNRRLAVDMPPQPVHVEGDRVRLVQIVSNLLDNAVKFTDAEGHIALDVVPEGERVEIRVQDDGKGIPLRHLDNIFEPFVQAEPGLGAGLGIGLSLVRGLVELHGGTVSAESQGFGCGATFTVSLPLCRSEPAQPAADKATEFDVLQTQCRVLVVDDNRDITEGLRLLLTILGAEVRVAHDGAKAVRICDDWLPTHVLMDIGMPGMDGYEAARRLRTKHPDSAFRLIAVTGWGQEEDRQRAREAGFDEHLVKPVGVRELKTVLSS
ncbi:PAS domain S-box protein [Thioalkalivibrio sp.]|uniref:PAS domain S-box protein n=1 Tax=Thioalkalivibrio sp. TaxID=2093813 RepID=UPI003975458F